MTDLWNYCDPRYGGSDKFCGFINYALNNNTNNKWAQHYVQGSVGANSPMLITANEYFYTGMKHGSNTPRSYRGNLQVFSEAVTPQLREDVRRCGHKTFNPVGCSMTGVRQVLGANNEENAYGVSYETGAQPFMQHIPPNYRHAYSTFNFSGK